MEPKEVAARRAVEMVRDGMTIGLGTGSTATYAIRALSERIQNEGLRLRGIPSSEGSRQQAADLGIPLASLTDCHEIDITIDGADEVDPALNLIKGGGGALVREKLVASASRDVLIIVDENKIKPVLGGFPLPVAILPWGCDATMKRLAAFGTNVTLRHSKDAPTEPFRTDDGLYIADIALHSVLDAAELERDIKRIVGVAEVGLFIGLATHIIVGYPDGTSKILQHTSN